MIADKMLVNNIVMTKRGKNIERFVETQLIHCLHCNEWIFWWRRCNSDYFSFFFFSFNFLFLISIRSFRAWLISLMLYIAYLIRFACLTYSRHKVTTNCTYLFSQFHSLEIKLIFSEFYCFWCGGCCCCCFVQMGKSTTSLIDVKRLDIMASFSCVLNSKFYFDLSSENLGKLAHFCRMGHPIRKQTQNTIVHRKSRWRWIVSQKWNHFKLRLKSCENASLTIAW